MFMRIAGPSSRVMFPVCLGRGRAVAEMLDSSTVSMVDIGQGGRVAWVNGVAARLSGVQAIDRGSELNLPPHSKPFCHAARSAGPGAALSLPTPRSPAVDAADVQPDGLDPLRPQEPSPGRHLSLAVRDRVDEAGLLFLGKRTKIEEGTACRHQVDPMAARAGACGKDHGVRSICIATQ